MNFHEIFWNFSSNRFHCNVYELFLYAAKELEIGMEFDLYKK
jgi:hypothetical protein